MKLIVCYKVIRNNMEREVEMYNTSKSRLNKFDLISRFLK